MAKYEIDDYKNIGNDENMYNYKNMYIPDDYKNIKLSKSMYKNKDKSLSEMLEDLDPTENYEGSSLGRLDAFGRQLKRFDIKVNGKNSDPVKKFFGTESAKILFPEYISRSINVGIEEETNLQDIVAKTIKIDNLSYKTLYLDQIKEDKFDPIAEGGDIPEIKISLKDKEIKLKKIGRMISCSYETLQYQKISEFTTILKHIGKYFNTAIFKEAIKTILNGDGNENKIKEINPKGKFTYQNIIEAWTALKPYNLNTIIVGPKSIDKLLSIPELVTSKANSNYIKTGILKTVLGAKIIYTDAIEDEKIIAMDKNYTLNYIISRDCETESDKVIEKQLYKYVITKTYAFTKIITDASVCLNCKA